MPAARERASTSSSSTFSDRVGSVAATPPRSAPALADTSASRRCWAAFWAATAVASRIRRSSTPTPVVAEVVMTWTPGIPSSAASRDRSLRIWPVGLATQAVGLVEDHHRDGVVGGQDAQVVVVQPRVGVLLRVGDPHEHVDELEHPLGLDPVGDDPRVEVGQVEQHQAVEGPGRGVGRVTRTAGSRGGAGPPTASRAARWRPPCPRPLPPASRWSGVARRRRRRPRRPAR